MLSAMSDLVRVYASGDTVAADLMRARLEAEGITVLTKGEGEGPYRAGPAYLFVPTSDEEQARAIVEAVESGAFALEDDDVLSPAEGDAP
jgi:putative signal transducing protein